MPRININNIIDTACKPAITVAGLKSNPFKNVNISWTGVVLSGWRRDGAKLIVFQIISQ